jgi:hypothetical protein
MSGPTGLDLNVGLVDKVLDFKRSQKIHHL